VAGRKLSQSSIDMSHGNYGSVHRHICPSAELLMTNRS
jgi:hypothetical protein